MQIKRVGGRIFGAHLTVAEQQAVEIEINKQILIADEKYKNNIDAMILWTLHTYLGFGPKRLRDFYEAFNRIHDSLVSYYEMEDSDDAWICMQKLKDMGVDVEAWNKEESHG